ncbi:Chromatin modification-related protein png1 [Termitomyces sp. T112]|nr:Chromatin modification-related protein png1 [Termitomyces sp. T112]
MPPSRNSAVVAANDPADNPPYSLALLSEYTHTLDALPLELSRNFADLRELDAVLSSSMASLTSKINKLTLMIENKEDKQERLWLLAEIADEAARLKLGGDDKIRVACQAADNLKYNMAHLKNLTEHIPNFDPSTLDRKTTYPHVSARSFMPALPPENTRRRRGGYGSLLTSAPDPSPAKKRQRVLQRDDDLDIMRSPKKDKNELNARSRARAKKSDRPASPSESLVSVTSHVLPPTNGISSYRGAANGASARGAGSAAGSKRSRPSASNRSATPHAGDPYEQNGMHPNGHGGNSRRDAYSVPQSSHHASLPHPYQNGAAPNGTHAHHPSPYEIHVMPPNIPGAQDWNPPLAQQLEGPGMPVSRGVTMPIIPINTAIGPGIPGDTGDAGDGEGDGDDRRYCFCNGISYGEMIACDDSQCEREWFHLACIGLVVPPEGRWFCDACRNKRNAKRSGRGGKRRAGGGRAGTRAS